MQRKYIPALVMLIAGAATSIINLYKKVELLTSLKRLLLVLVIFYFIGLIARAVIGKAMQLKPKEEEETVPVDTAVSDQGNTDSPKAKK